ncbi:hypothetical protein [Dyadobacter arcticus]|uniref:Uncharacterized protein n=1 Tax=Dyadobacter arcticus TaxID=1078754 RepID=A0ABX0UM53_9BACT|nr:hypothetical protein [Dyadobacter arcticus]NIJ53992.1 hypothetical protein [Dyadobacter arcticus]
MNFLVSHALPLQQHLGVLIKKLNLETNEYGVLNYNAAHIFSPSPFNVKAFPGYKGASQQKVKLGNTVAIVHKQ